MSTGQTPQKRLKQYEDLTPEEIRRVHPDSTHYQYSSSAQDNSTPFKRPLKDLFKPIQRPKKGTPEYKKWRQEQRLGRDPYGFARLVRLVYEHEGLDPKQYVYDVMIAHAKIRNKSNYRHPETHRPHKPFRDSQWKGFTRSELNAVRKWLSEDRDDVFGDDNPYKETVRVEFESGWHVAFGDGWKVEFGPAWKSWNPFRWRVFARVRSHLGGTHEFNGRRGHMRNQYYPSTKSHAPKFISSIPKEGRKEKR